MLNIITRIKSFLDKFLFSICIVIMTVLVIDVSWQVLSRYLVGEPSLYTDELARFLMVWLTFLGGAYMFGSDSHLSVNSLRDMMPAKMQNAIFIFTYLLIGGFAVLVMIMGSQRLILRTLSQPSPSLGIPMGYFYSILPLSAAFIIIYMLLNLGEMFYKSKAVTKQEQK
ncbi:MAG: TRAP transporter small permease [Succinatimonas sp.]|nr:TRAP transporter small permease [Succinatimonas sp.]